MTSPRPDIAQLEAHQNAARAWFVQLRDNICSEFELLERDAPEALYGP